MWETDTLGREEKIQWLSSVSYHAEAKSQVRLKPAEVKIMEDAPTQGLEKEECILHFPQALLSWHGHYFRLKLISEWLVFPVGSSRVLGSPGEILNLHQ